MTPILPKQLKAAKPQCLQGFESGFNENNSRENNLKNKNRMQTNDKLYTLLSPILPLSLSTKKPKNRKFLKEILTVGYELRKMRIDKNLTQHEVAKQLNVNKNFIYELELNKRKATIYALHKIYTFFGSIPKTLKIDKTTLQGKLFEHRIKNGLAYSKLAEQIGLDKNTLIRVERGKPIKQETKLKILSFFV